VLRVAVLQSNYLPWVGYFDLIQRVDLCVFYDDVQFTKNDWRNRNRIPTKNGLEWITIPVGQSTSRLINEVQILDSSWQDHHYKRLVNNYRIKSTDSYSNEILNTIFKMNQWTNLSTLNQSTIEYIAKNHLGIKTQFDNSIYFVLEGKGESRLLCLLQQIGATHYLSGPAGKNYLSYEHFDKAGVTLEYMKYPNYKEYEQLTTTFTPNVSIIDLLFNLKTKASTYLS
jgi:hypothetical protein